MFIWYSPQNDVPYGEFYDNLVNICAIMLRKARKTLKYSCIYVFLTKIVLYLYEKFVDLQRDLETRMLNLKE